LKTNLLKALFILVITIFYYSFCIAQATGRLIFLKTIRNDDDVILLNDSLPLFITDGKVFQMDPECLVRDAGDGSNERASADGVNDRKAGDGVNDRKAGDGVNDRKAGDGVNDRKAGDGVNDRKAGDGVNDRKAGDGVNDRKAGDGVNDRKAGDGVNDRKADDGANDRKADNGVDDYTCDIDAKRNLIIYFHKIKLDKSCKVYFNHKFYNIKDKKFKIQQL
jgi:hypothetical protein